MLPEKLQEKSNAQLDGAFTGRAEKSHQVMSKWETDPYSPRIRRHRNGSSRLALFLIQIVTFLESYTD